jgi:O-antigen/teichoic acid export membrane protein
MRLHPFLFDVLTTGLTQVGTLVANFVMVGVVSRQMGAAVLGEYLLVKRVSAWLLVASMLGLGIALPRQIAHTVANVEMRARQYFLTAFTIVIAFVSIIGMAAFWNAGRLARWCLGSQNCGLIYAMLLLLLGLAAQAMVFGYFRGLERVQMANMVAFVGAAGVPLFALGMTYRLHSAPVLIGVTGAVLAALSFLWAIPQVVATARQVGRQFLIDARQLLTYGIGRVPGDVAAGGLLALGPMVVSHYANMAEDSYLLLGTTCMAMAGVAIAPVSMVLLARISRLLGAGRHRDVSEYVGHLQSAVWQVSLVLVIQGLIFARPLVLWWLGPSCVAGVPVIRMVMLGIPASMYFAGLRTVVDAASPVAYNARNVVLTMAVLTGLLGGVIAFVPREKIVMAVAAATTVAIWVLAVATHRTLQALVMTDPAHQFSTIGLAALLGTSSLAAQWAFHFQITKPEFILVMLVNSGLAFVLLRKSQPEWLGFMLRVAFSRT